MNSHPRKQDQSLSQAELPVIATRRLILRARSPDDAEALFPAMSDREIMAWWSRAPFISITELRDHFAPDRGGRVARLGDHTRRQ